MTKQQQQRQQQQQKQKKKQKKKKKKQQQHTTKTIAETTGASLCQPFRSQTLSVPEFAFFKVKRCIFK